MLDPYGLRAGPPSPFRDREISTLGKHWSPGKFPGNGEPSQPSGGYSVFWLPQMKSPQVIDSLFPIFFLVAAEYRLEISSGDPGLCR